MASRFKPDDTVYLVGNGRFIEEATVVMTVSGFVTIRFKDRSGGTRVRESRLYPTRKEAETAVKK